MVMSFIRHCERCGATAEVNNWNGVVSGWARITVWRTGSSHDTPGAEHDVCDACVAYALPVKAGKQ